MSKLTGNDINRLHAAYLADPTGQAAEFWAAVRSWVVRSVYSIPNPLKDDAIQDTMVSIIECLPSYDATPITKTVVDGVVNPGRGNFVKWVNGIIRNERYDSYRRLYANPEISISQLGAVQEDGVFLEFDPAELLEKPDADDLVTDKDRAIQASARLDDLRASFKQQADVDLFDLVRAGRSLTQAAAELGLSYAAAQRRFARWKNKVGNKVSDCLLFPERNSVERNKRAA